MEPHEVDVVALALIAVGIFLGGVAYFGWAGGSVGHASVGALRFLVGALAYAVPVVLVIGRGPDPGAGTAPARAAAAHGRDLSDGGGLAGARRGHAWRRPRRRAGAAFLVGGHDRSRRGGILGAVEFWVAGHMFSTAGADILAVFLALTGILLLSGATFASVVLAARRSATGALRRAEIAQATRRVATAGRAGSRRRSSARPPTRPGPWSFPSGAGPGRAGSRSPSSSCTGLTSRRRPSRLRSSMAWRPTRTRTSDQEQPAQLSFAELEEPGTEEEVDSDATNPTHPPPTAGEAEARRPSRELDASDLTPQGRFRASVTDDPDFVWRVPEPRFLVRATGDAAKPDTAGQAQVAAALVEALGHFGIDAKVVGRVTGPHITRYELRLAPGIKVSKVASLKDDLAYALAATDIRILAPIPGKTAVGVEVPNARRRIVHLGDVFQEPPADWSPLTVWLGKDISGKAIGADLAKMPHLLVAGTTGSGKSACVNAMLSSVLLRATPHEVRLVLVDPKQVELNHYESIPHLLTPVITSPRMAANALQNLVKEMEQRYGTMSLARTRSLPELNKARERRGEPPLPYILCVIDELADLMMVAPADVEDSIIRLAQKARAVGIHLVLATQSPRVDVITGMIKANVPSRIAFAVSSQTDSRVILDQNGAESLLGQGDMLFSPVGSSKLQRIQGAFIDEAQIADLTEAWRRQGEPEFKEELLEEVEDEGSGGSDDEDDALHPDEDPLLEEAIWLVAQMGTASTSMLQRRLRLGYTRAGRLIDMLERRGIISGYEGSKPRQVLITEADVPRILVHLAEGSAGGPEGLREDRAGDRSTRPESPGATLRRSPGGPAPATASPEGAEASPGGSAGPVEPPSAPDLDGGV